jgi:hypothetical protein
MNQRERKSTTGTNAQAALIRTLRSVFNLLPVIVGTFLLTSLAFTLIPKEGFKALFGRHEILDVLLGAGMGSIAAGNPLAGYILGGELLAGGASLIAVTAMIVSWVTVGIVQLPAEALLLGRRFAMLRNLLSFLFAIAIAFLTVGTLRLIG